MIDEPSMTEARWLRPQQRIQGFTDDSGRYFDAWLADAKAEIQKELNMQALGYLNSLTIKVTMTVRKLSGMAVGVVDLTACWGELCWWSGGLRWLVLMECWLCWLNRVECGDMIVMMDDDEVESRHSGKGWKSSDCDGGDGKSWRKAAAVMENTVSRWAMMKDWNRTTAQGRVVVWGLVVAVVFSAALWW
jgi:hypothetical protein